MILYLVQRGREPAVIYLPGQLNLPAFLHPGCPIPVARYHLHCGRYSKGMVGAVADGTGIKIFEDAVHLRTGVVCGKGRCALRG